MSDWSECFDLLVGLLEMLVLRFFWSWFLVDFVWDLQSSQTIWHCIHILFPLPLLFFKGKSFLVENEWPFYPLLQVNKQRGSQMLGRLRRSLRKKLTNVLFSKIELSLTILAMNACNHTNKPSYIWVYIACISKIELLLMILAMHACNHANKPSYIWVYVACSYCQ